MKYSLPLFATFSLTVLLWGACSPQESSTTDGQGGYEAAPAAIDGDMGDTGTYNRNPGADTLHSTMHNLPARPDSTNRMPPQQ